MSQQKVLVLVGGILPPKRRRAQQATLHVVTHRPRRHPGGPGKLIDLVRPLGHPPNLIHDSTTVK